MSEQLIKFIERIKLNPKVSSFDEASTKQAIILPLLNILGWNTYDIDEVKPEFSVENRRVDYSLRLNNSNEVFIEVKKTGEELDNYHEAEFLISPGPIEEPKLQRRTYTTYCRCTAQTWWKSTKRRG